MIYVFHSFIALLLLSSSVWAQEYAYVTDSLQLRVYASPSVDSELLQTIDSGDSVEVFETQEGFSKVTTYDGTVGWVKTAFLVEEPPAKLLYYSVGEKNKQLEAEIEALKNNPPVVNTMDTTGADEEQIKELQNALAEQQELNKSLKQQAKENNAVATDSSTLVVNKAQTVHAASNINTWLIALAAALFFGLLSGLKISSWRMEKRLHGFRFK